MLLTLTTPTVYAPQAGVGVGPVGFAPAGLTGGAGAGNIYQYGTSADYVMGLKNWFGSVIHSFTLDMNGTTIIQQTPFINMVNCFRLLTSLSYNDLITQGSVIGFFPDDTSSWSVNMAPANGGGGATPNGGGVCNNTLFPAQTLMNPDLATARILNNYNSDSGNYGLVRRIQNINFDPDGVAGVSLGANGAVTVSTKYGQLLSGSSTQVNAAYVPASGGSTSAALTQLWISFISTKRGASTSAPLVAGVLQVTVMSTIYLKHIHNFFAMIPLLKGTFFKMTAFLNNASTVFTIASKITDLTGATFTQPLGASVAGQMTLNSVAVPVGGVNPLMISSAAIGQGASSLGNAQYTASLSVGSRCLNAAQANLAGVGQGACSPSIYLYVPAYTFNPVFESAYLSSPVKSIKYSDYYQYQVLGVGAGQNFNNLITNGIANIKSVLIMPYYSASLATGAQASGLPAGVPVYQSPFDPAGAACTSPLCLFNNFNVVISGQNAIYNTEQRAFEHFNDWVKGCNSVNGDLTDGLTSGLLGFDSFLREQCFYYTPVGRQLPVEEQVPKSVQIVGQNQSNFALDLFVFIEYGVAVDVDALTGARV